MGNDYLLIPIAAVIIGGTNIMGGSGGYVGSISGTLIVVLLQSVLATVQIHQAGKNIIFGAIIIVLLLAYGREKTSVG
jgi:ribose transport system permease protein